MGDFFESGKRQAEVIGEMLRLSNVPDYQNAFFENGAVRRLRYATMIRLGKRFGVDFNTMLACFVQTTLYIKQLLRHLLPFFGRRVN